MSFKNTLYRMLESPQRPEEKAVAYLLLGAILFSVLILGIRLQYPRFYETYRSGFTFVERAILILFSVEYLMRLWVMPQRWRYMFSFAGLIDLMAVVPSWMALVLPSLANFTWLRTLRILRFLRALKLISGTRYSYRLWSGILARIGPYIGIALLFKLLVLAGEAQPWWFELNKLNTMLTVAGFAIGILLGSKLSTAQSRMYGVEDAVTNIVGDLRGLSKVLPNREPLAEWASCFLSTLRRDSAPANDRFDEINDRVASLLAEHKAPAPMVASLHQQTAFLLLRRSTRTPRAYERFLRHVTVLYTLAVILAMPGLVGLISVVLVVYILGGIYIVIDDIDRPISEEGVSIQADISPLQHLVKEWTTTPRKLERG